MSEGAAAAKYVMGHTDRERRRLALQASIINPFTDQLFCRAGIAPGMRVLDIGCGVGDVTLIAARIVGRHGWVTAIDLDSGALAIAQERAREEGLTNIAFVQGNVNEYLPEHPFDAVVGRHILVHTSDALAVLKSARQVLSERGVVAFHEYDFSVFHTSYPPCPIRDRTFCIFQDFFRPRVPYDMGTRLYHLFLQAGFVAPDCRVEYPIDGGPDSPFYEWVAESLRSILPAAEAAGVVQPGEINIDALAEEMRHEAVTAQACSPAPLMVGGFARCPTSR